MYTAQCSHEGCECKFTKTKKVNAQQALRRHIGRVHTESVQKLNGENGKHVGVLMVDGSVGNQTAILGSRNRLIPVSNLKLSPEEAVSLVEFIRKNKDDFPTKSKCFVAGLEATGLTGRIQVNGSTVDRYFKKAKIGKRNYVKRDQSSAVEQVEHKTLNYCSACGHNLKAQALASVLAERILSGASVTIDGKKVEYAG